MQLTQILSSVSKDAVQNVELPKIQYFYDSDFYQIGRLPSISNIRSGESCILAALLVSLEPNRVPACIVKYLSVCFLYCHQISFQYYSIYVPFSSYFYFLFVSIFFHCVNSMYTFSAQNTTLCHKSLLLVFRKNKKFHQT